jgi:hypothetical protein
MGTALFDNSICVIGTVVALAPITVPYCMSPILVDYQ